jgi:hypothetical protein
MGCFSRLLENAPDTKAIEFARRLEWPTARPKSARPQRALPSPGRAVHEASEARTGHQTCTYNFFEATSQGQKSVRGEKKHALGPHVGAVVGPTQTRSGYPSTRRVLLVLAFPVCSKGSGLWASTRRPDPSKTGLVLVDKPATLWVWHKLLGRAGPCFGLFGGHSRPLIACRTSLKGPPERPSERPSERQRDRRGVKAMSQRARRGSVQGIVQRNCPRDRPSDHPRERQRDHPSDPPRGHLSDRPSDRPRVRPGDVAEQSLGPLDE